MTKRSAFLVVISLSSALAFAQDGGVAETNPDSYVQLARQRCEAIATEMADDYYGNEIAAARKEFDRFLRQLTKDEKEVIRSTIALQREFVGYMDEINKAHAELKQSNVELEDARKKYRDSNYGDAESANFQAALRKNDAIVQKIEKNEAERAAIQPKVVEMRYKAENYLYSLLRKQKSPKLSGLTAVYYTYQTEQAREIRQQDIQQRVESSPRTFFFLHLEMPKKDGEYQIYLTLNFDKPETYELRKVVSEQTLTETVVFNRLFKAYPNCDLIWERPNAPVWERNSSQYRKHMDPKVVDRPLKVDADL